MLMGQKDFNATLKGNVHAKNISVATNVTNAAKLTEIIQNVMFARKIIMDTKLTRIVRLAIATVAEVKVCNAIKKLENVNAMKILLVRIVLSVKMVIMDQIAKVSYGVTNSERPNLFSIGKL